MPPSPSRRSPSLGRRAHRSLSPRGGVRLVMIVPGRRSNLLPAGGKARAAVMTGDLSRPIADWGASTRSRHTDMPPPFCRFGATCHFHRPDADPDTRWRPAAPSRRRYAPRSVRQPALARGELGGLGGVFTQGASGMRWFSRRSRAAATPSPLADRVGQSQLRSRFAAETRRAPLDPEHYDARDARCERKDRPGRIQEHEASARASGALNPVACKRSAPGSQGLNA